MADILPLLAVAISSVTLVVSGVALFRSVLTEKRQRAQDIEQARLAAMLQYSQTEHKAQFALSECRRIEWGADVLLSGQLTSSDYSDLHLIKSHGQAFISNSLRQLEVLRTLKTQADSALQSVAGEQRLDRIQKFREDIRQLDAAISGNEEFVRSSGEFFTKVRQSAELRLGTPAAREGALGATAAGGITHEGEVSSREIGSPER